MRSYHFSVGDEAGVGCPEARSSSAEAGHEGKREARLLNQLGRKGVVAARPLHNNVIDNVMNIHVINMCRAWYR